MKCLEVSSACFLLACITLIPASARGDLEVSATVQIHSAADFEPGLSAHGVWVEVGSHGRCWRPKGVAVGWRPYCHGEWVWTDRGWYWSSDEPWAWACYHYGSWTYDSHGGWIWVPGVEWAPAWVSWRVGGGHIGWAPLPPRGWFFARHPGPDAFVFVGAKHFGGPIKPSIVVTKNRAVFDKAPVVGGVKKEARNFPGSSRSVFVNSGPDVKMVQKVTGRTLEAKPIQEVARQTKLPGAVKAIGAEVKAGREAREFKAQPKPDSGHEITGGSEHPPRSMDRSFTGRSSQGSRGGGGGGGRGKH